MAFLDGRKIQKELFEEGPKTLADEWKLSKAMAWDIEMAFGCLLSYSLVRPLGGNDVSMHLLVQEVIQEHVQFLGHDFANVALKLVRSLFPWGGGLENINQCLKYISQVKVCTRNDSGNGTYSDELVWLVGSLGAFYNTNGQYDLAIDQYKWALRIYENAFGVDHINTASTINNLGNTYDIQGKYDEAIA